MNLSTFWGGAAAPYEIEQSLRFDDSNNYLYRNFGSASSSTTQTWSFWMKMGWRPMEDGTYHALLCSNNNQTIWRFTSDPGSGNYEDLILSGQFNGWSTRHSFRDPHAWVHVMIVYDTTNGTASNRLRHYYNGVRHPKENGPDPGSSANIGFGQSGTHNIGRQVAGGEYWEGLLAEFHMVDGQALDPTEFGEFSSEHGGWIPKKYSGSYGNNGFYLKFDPGAANGVGHDHSGRGNHWSASGFNTNSNFPTGDVLFDTPTTNCSNFVPLNNTESNYGIFNSNQHVDTNSGTNVAPATFAVKSGKWYAEFEIDAWNSASAKFGWHDMSGDELDHCEQNTFTLMHYTNGAHYVWENGSGTQYSSTAGLSPGNIVGLALDADNNNAYMYVNGSLRKTINLNSHFTAGTRYLAPWVGFAAGSGAAVYYCNFGNQFTQQYNPPTGYKVWRASNLPDPPIKNPKENVKALTYTGNGGTLAVTAGFAPNLVVIKNRTSARNWQVFDTYRGAGKTLYFNLTDQESTNQSGGYLSAFSSTGFSVTHGGGASDVNYNGDQYSAYCWKEGATPGFDIVTYTGNGSARTISHSLGVKPKVIIVKRRSASSHWTTYFDASWAGATRYFLLNQNNAVTNTTSVIWNNTEPTASVFSLGSNGDLNGNGSTYVAYLFSEVEGFSKFGEYPGNGSSNGPFVYTGFKPAIVITKVVDSAGEWYIHDNAREIDNPNVNVFKINRPDQDTANAGFYEMDFLSNGFKLRTGNSSINWGGRRFMFWAWAETPFKYTTAK